MKLQDFSDDRRFANVLRTIGAPLVYWEPGPLPLDDAVEEKLQRGEIELKTPKDIPTDETGLLTFDGHRVVVYIRDQINYTEQLYYNSGTGTSNYRFHLTDCATIVGMKRSGRYKKRYVYTNRSDGSFWVNRVDGGRRSSESSLVEMKLCLNCWHHLQSLGYSQQMNVKYEKFSLDDYFKKFSNRIAELPLFTPGSAPVSEYSKAHSKIAEILKRKVEFVCQECSTGFGSKRYLLDLHHIDGRKDNYAQSNLRVLCADCHSRQPVHSHMRWQPRVGECQAFKRQSN